MSTKSRIREQAQKGIYDGLKESISDYSEEVILQVASDIEDAVFQYFGSNEHNKTYNEKILFLKMRIKGSRNSKTRSALLQRKIDLKELIELKSSEFTDQFFSEKLGSGDNQESSQHLSSNILSSLNDQQEQELSNAPPPTAANPFSANPFQRVVTSQSNASANRIGGKSRYVNPNQFNSQQTSQQSSNPPVLPPSEIETIQAPPPADFSQTNAITSQPPTNKFALNTPSPFFNEDSPTTKLNNFHQSPPKQETLSNQESPEKQNDQIHHNLNQNYEQDSQFHYQDPVPEVETKKQEQQVQIKNNQQKPIPTFHAPVPPPTRQTQKQNIPHPTKNEQPHHVQPPQQHVENQQINFETPTIHHDFHDSSPPVQFHQDYQQVHSDQQCQTSSQVNNEKLTNMLNEAVKSIQNNLLQQFEIQNSKNQQKIEELERRLNQQNSLISTHQSQDNSVSHQQVSILEQKFVTLNQTLQNQQVFVNNLENSIQSLTIQVTNIKSTQDQQTILLNQGSIRSPNQLSQTEIEQYTNMINNLQQENIDLRNQLNASKENETQNKLTIQKMTILIDQLQAQNNQLQDKNEQLGQSIIQLNHSLSEIQQVSQLQKQQIMQFTSTQLQIQQQQLQQQQQLNQSMEQQKQPNKPQQVQQNINNQFSQPSSNQTSQLQPPQQPFQQSSPQTTQKTQIPQAQQNSNPNQLFSQHNSNVNHQKNNSSINQQMSYLDVEDFFDSLNGSIAVQNNLQSSKNDDSQRNSVIQGHHTQPQAYNTHQNVSNTGNQSSFNPPAQNYPQKTQQIQPKMQNQQMPPPTNIPQNQQNVGYSQNQVQQQQQQSQPQPNRTVVPAPAGAITQKSRRVAKGMEDMFN